MPELTDAQHLAAARALLGMAPGQFSDLFVLDRSEALVNPEFIRAALAIAFEAGRESMRPHATPTVLTWGYDEALQPAEIRDAVRTGCVGHVTEVDTGSDDYVVVLSTTPLTAEQARQVWEAQP